MSASLLKISIFLGSQGVRSTCFVECRVSIFGITIILIGEVELSPVAVPRNLRLRVSLLLAGSRRIAPLPCLGQDVWEVAAAGILTAVDHVGAYSIVRFCCKHGDKMHRHTIFIE